MLKAQQARFLALLGAGALAVHELRYLATYGSRTEEALAHQGHAYLNVLTPLVGLALAGLLGHLLYRLAWGTEPGQCRVPSRAAAALAFTGGLLTIFVSQEVLEGLLASGHPTGLDGVFGHGGWLAVPLAAVLGLGFSLLVACARRAVARVQRAIGLLLPRLSAPPIRTSAGEVVVVHAAPLARHLAGRAPPVA